MAKRIGHIGPFQQFTECCMACWNNVYETDECIEEGEAEQILGARRRDYEQAEIRYRAFQETGVNPCADGHAGPISDSDYCISCGEHVRY